MKYNDLETVPATWKVGDVILEQYEVKELFTGGGMGLVYRVHHRDWAMDLAVKSPRPEFFQTQQHIENFEREAETWVNLGLHPHTVSCYYVRRLGSIPRIFAEFVEAGTLGDWIRTKMLYEGSQEKALQRTIDVAIQSAWGLHFAHEGGLVHQDVKPGNVLMSPDGSAKVTDFGLTNARRVSAESATVAARPGQSILVPGSGFMTQEYASPEQLRGERLSRKTDVWSWAVSLLEMLLEELTWANGSAAPAVLEDLDKGRLDEDLIALLCRCFGSGSCTRWRSFEPVIQALMACYTTRFGKYLRMAPEPVQLSCDEINNRALSMLDLGKEDEALLTLETALSSDPTHTITIYNYALINGRRGYKSDEFGRDALYALLQRDPDDALSLVANALFCMERGLAFRAADLLVRLEALGGEKPPQAVDLEAMVRETPKRELERPVLFKACDGEIRFLQVSPDGKYLIVRDPDGLASYVAATGDRCLKLANEYDYLQLAGDNALLKKEGRVFTWNLCDEPEILKEFHVEIPEGECFAVSNSGNRCCVVEYNVLRMVDTDNGETLWEEELDFNHENGPSIKDVVFSSDERFVSFARSDYLEDLQVLKAEDGCTVRMGKCAVDGCKGLIPFGKRIILSINWHRLLQLWDLEERAALGSRQLHQKAQLGVPSANTELIASLEPNGPVRFFQTPRLSLLATVAWWELLIDTVLPRGNATFVASADARTWYIATSEQEIVRFQWSKPHRAPLFIARPSSQEQLNERWRMQANLLQQAERDCDAGAFGAALKKSRAAVRIRGGRNLEAAELHDEIAASGRKQGIVNVRLAFDIDRTILGYHFKFIDVTPDCRFALAERVVFGRDKEYRDDHYRVVQLPRGCTESVPGIESTRRLLRRLTPKGDSVIAATKSGFVVVPLRPEGRSARSFNAPAIPADTFRSGSQKRMPSYYASDIQFALGGEIVVAADLASEWCPSKRRCEEWHLFTLGGAEVMRVATDTPHLRIMQDGCHAYAHGSTGIYWFDWPFKDARIFAYPRTLNESQIAREAVAVTSDGARLLVGDESGKLHVWDQEGSRYQGWQTFDAHQNEITRVFAGADPRFVASVASDGVKIWDLGSALTGAYSGGSPEQCWHPGCESLLWSDVTVQPRWMSDDFRFLIEDRGTVWEIEWDYSFEVPGNVEQLAGPHIENWLRCRQALAEIDGDQPAWNEDACDLLARELTKRGCGGLSGDSVDSLVRAKFPHLIREHLTRTQ